MLECVFMKFLKRDMRHGMLTVWTEGILLGCITISYPGGGVKRGESDRLTIPCIMPARSRESPEGWTREHRTGNGRGHKSHWCLFSDRGDKHPDVGEISGRWNGGGRDARKAGEILGFTIFLARNVRGLPSERCANIDVKMSPQKISKFLVKRGRT